MKLIDKIIEELVDDSKSLSSALLKTKVLASKLDNDSVFIWVNNELNGYPNAENLPEYRIIPASATGTFASRFVIQKNVAIPWMSLDQQFQDFLTKMRITNSISNLEYHITNDIGDLGSLIPAEMCAYISSAVGKGFALTGGKVSASKNLIVEVIGNVRSRLLDFLLQLNKDFTEESEFQNKSSQIDNIFSGTIVGNNNVILSGSHNTQSVNYEINYKDTESLIKALKNKNISEIDLDELRTIVESEKINNNTQEYGPRLKQWFSKMLNKSIDGSWNIPVSIASSMLSEAFKSYFGF